MQADLVSRLEAGCSIVTPTRRLAAQLKRDYDLARFASGGKVWPAADILPLSAFVERAYSDALHSGLAAALPVLLAPAQEQALWEAVVRESGAGRDLLAVPETAALAREAWELSHAWCLAPRIAGFPLNEDGRAFREWSQRYAAVTGRERQTDAARLAGVVAPLLGSPEIRKPRALVRYGFDLVLPRQSALFDALAATGCEVTSARPAPRTGERGRLACADSSDEIRRAATWARARLEAGGARIGVVVPDLAKHRGAIQRIFGASMEPAYALPGTRHPVFPFNLSLGAPLASYPLVQCALLVLELAGRESAFDAVSRLLRSPFIGGAEAELSPRARLDSWLRARAEPALALDRLVALVARSGADCPDLARRLAALAEFRKARLFGGQAPSAWARAISEALALLGFPGERALDSGEFQTLGRWQAALAEFAGLDRILPRTGFADAAARLRRIAADTLFQPETPEVPIQVLGELEATGMEFDHLWVMGLSDESWPRGPRPNPFLPVELQRAAGVPQGSAAGMLALARRLTHEWLASAAEVVLSHPTRENDRELKPSPLIAGLHESALDLPRYRDFRDVVHVSRCMENREDAGAPPVRGAAPGGIAVIRDQAACPFRAVARHRLGAESLAAPHTGLNALERGTLAHGVLAGAWSRLRTRAGLAAISAAELDSLLAQAAEAAIAGVRRERPTVLAGRFVGIEKRRLVRLARDFLALEAERADFTVVATEDTRRIALGGLTLDARLDRVDETDDGRRIVIDYKTGEANPGAMLGERPDEPQLPLYVVGAEPDAVAAAFAQLRTGEMRFAALARDADLLPGVRALADSPYRDRHASWREALDAWRENLARIAAGFAAGDARVDPKRYPDACRYCDVKPFCRIYERIENPLDGDAG
ncbi:MAG: PD-(D/E)XK nuclease family protein [Burkholderiales bacterium]|nr:PD-(D/E)XK nuclease family protein [Burkholderiales bacterium]